MNEGPTHFIRRYHNVFLFVGGFLFDMVTIRRIDSWPDLALQLSYLAILTCLLVYQYHENTGTWAPPPRIASFWKYNVELLHFFYGGLLSAYVVLYFKSSTGARPIVFFVVLLLLMFMNEMPQVRRFGYRLRLGLYAFCVSSFLHYFLPVLIGRMGSLVFGLSMALSAAWVWQIAGWLAGQTPGGKPERIRLFAPAGVLLSLIVVLYAFRLIPPVPLSVQFQGIYHNVQKTGDSYVLTYEAPRFYRFWRKDSRPFMARPGDVVYYFARVFAPARFEHRVVIRWELYKELKGAYQTTDTIPLSVSGGRAEGFRGFAAKSNFQPGRWRVTAETEDGRAIGLLTFYVVSDSDEDSRAWSETEM
ncbi:MAG: DUF2914 domain-containing protein [Vicinamibacterales bacterium]